MNPSHSQTATAPAAGPSQPSLMMPPPPSGGGTAIGGIDPIKLLTKYVWVLAATGVVGLGLGVGVQMLLARTIPAYTAEVVWEVLQPETSVIDFSPTIGTEQQERRIATEVRKMSGLQVLESVVRDPRLASLAPEWFEARTKGGVLDDVEAMEDLDDALSIFPITDTNLIMMRVKARTPENAMALAGLVKDAYTTQLTTQVRLDATDRKDILQRQINSLEEQIDRRKQEFDRIVSSEGIDAMQAEQGQDQQQLRSFQEELQEVELRLTELNTQIAQFEAATNVGADPYTDVMRSIVSQNPLMVGMRQQITSLETEDSSLQQNGLSENHRARVNIRNRINANTQEMNAQRDRLLQELFNGQFQQALNERSELLARQLELTTEERRLVERVIVLTANLENLENLDGEIERLIEQKIMRETERGELDQVSELPSFQGLRVQQREREPDRMSFPPEPYIAAPLGAVLLTGLVGGLLFAREALDQRVKGPSDIAMIPRTRIAGLVPDAGDDPAGTDSVEHAFTTKPDGVLAESFRQLRSTVVKRMASIDAQTLVVASGMPGSGASSVIANLAHAIAATELRVLVIDANLRRPAMRRIFDIETEAGLTDVLANEATLEDVIHHETEALHVLGAGTREHRVYERLATTAMTRLLDQVRDHYDFIIIDTPPMIVSGDGLTIANKCDASMLVVRAMNEKRGLVSRLKNDLNDNRSQFLGVLVNAVRPSAGGYMKKNIQATHDYQSA